MRGAHTHLTAISLHTQRFTSSEARWIQGQVHYLPPSTHSILPSISILSVPEGPPSFQLLNQKSGTGNSPTLNPHILLMLSPKDSAPYLHYHTESNQPLSPPGQPYFLLTGLPTHIQASFIIPMVARIIISKYKASCIPQLLKPLLWLPTFLRTETKALTWPARFQVVSHYLPL